MSSFNWFQRSYEEPEDAKEAAKDTEEQTGEDNEAKETPASSEDYLNWAKAAYQNIQARQAEVSPEEEGPEEEDTEEKGAEEGGTEEKNTEPTDHDAADLDTTDAIDTTGATGATGARDTAGAIDAQATEPETESPLPPP